MSQAYSATPASARDSHSLFVVAMPWLFVLIWSTGFIVAKYGMPYAEPITFLFLRFVGVLVCLLPLVWLARVPLPRQAGSGDIRRHERADRRHAADPDGAVCVDAG
jgi:hypothetical protein